MKKIILLLLLPLLILTGIALAPQLLKLEQVRVTIIEQLQSRFDNRMRIEQIQWGWLPAPHISLREMRIENDRAVSILPEAIIYPRWSSLFRKKLAIQEIVLKDPRIRLKKMAGKNENLGWYPGSAKIIVKNGTITFDDGMQMLGVSFSEPLQFSVPHAEIVFAGNWLQFNVAASSNLAKQLKILGKLDIAHSTYLARINCQDLRLRHVANIAHGRVIPVAQEVNLTAHIAGSGLDTITTRLQGELPSFLVNVAGKKLLLRCGWSDLTLAKNHDDLSVQIHELELKEPELTLFGTVARNLRQNAVDPQWHIDLQAKELNLSQIRDSILTLWADNEIADTVLNIVLGGRARTAAFAFDGPASDFHSLHAMTIAADVISAPIFVPVAELNLTEAHGAILIKNAILTGTDLSANLDQSRGQNCSLLLGLIGQAKPFRLDLDINADLAQLPAILDRVVHNLGFRKELARLSNVHGSAIGHLSIGDTLDAPLVEVMADKIKASLNYNRISWPLTLRNGSFKLAPGTASWQNVEGTVGPHTLAAAAGTVTWQKGKTTQMAIDLPAASIDSAALFSELAAHDFLPPSVKKNIIDVRGMVDLHNGSLTGPVQSPGKWAYHCYMKSADIQWYRLDRTTSASLQNVAAYISNNKLTLTDSTLLFSGRPFQVSAQFTHALLEKWQGTITIDGTINHEIGSWLRQKNWIPVAYFPRLPCTLKEFKITWEERPAKITGTIVAGEGGRLKPMATVTLATDGQTLVPTEIIFQNQAQRGHLTLALGKEQPQGLRLTWQGELRADTLQALFATNPLSDGVLRGNFRLDTASSPDVSFLEGTLAIDNLSWPCQDQEISLPTVLDLVVQGKDNLIVVKKLNLDLNANPLSLLGQATRSANGLDVNLELTAPRITLNDIRTLLADLKKRANRLGLNQAAFLTADDKSAGWDMTGSIKFNIAHLFLTPETAPTDIPQKFVQTLQPAIGGLVLTAGNYWNAQITQSRLCGIDLTGILYSDAVMGESSFDLRSPHDLLFQELLPCFGIEQDLVEGSFSLNGSLIGQPDNWTSGNLDIASSDGRILRMRLLARIFSLVNITDLFSPQDPSSIGQKGFRYTDLDLKTVIRDNRLIITKCLIKGEGLNLFAKGDIGLDTHEADLTVLVAPLKTIDAIVGRIPLIGRAIGGENTALVTIPVGIKGHIEDPDVTLLPAQAVGEGIVTLVQETLKLPFSILSPPRTDNQQAAPIEPAQ